VTIWPDPTFHARLIRGRTEIPHRALQSQIADSVQIIVHVERAGGRRRVAEIVEVAGFDADSDRQQFNPLYQCT